MSSAPPLWRYWPVYILCFSIACGLIWTWFTHVQHDTAASGISTGPVLFAGVAVAALAIIANTWSQWQTARISHALQGLQALRTDREYLINATFVRQQISHDPDSAWGQPLGPALVAAFRDTNAVSTVDAPSFRDASLFLLNQYEFLAAATRSGAIDFVLMQRTLGGPIRDLLNTYAPEIAVMRRKSPRAFTDLAWLHRTISGTRLPNLMPPAAED